MSYGKKIIILLGPTSSGKSDIAIRLAKKFNGEIISADSRQVYRGLDIGTGKVPRDVRCKARDTRYEQNSNYKYQKNKPYFSEGIPHYAIDIISPRTEYNAAKFKKDADKIVADILSREKLPIICGGTGFWIKAVVDNVHYPEVKPDLELRNRLRGWSTEKLFDYLKKIDPDRAKTIDAKNKVRLIRAIEIAKKLGFVPKINSNEKLVIGKNGEMSNCYLPFNNYSFLQIGIALPKEKLQENIKKRLQKRFAEGMINEVKKLHRENKLSWRKIESFGLGYFWIPKYLKGEIKTEEELFEKIFQAEKDYAKRQQTWFRKDERIVWLENYPAISRTVQDFIKK